jgi:hypothetical protein
MTNSVESRGVTHLESMNLSNALSPLWVGHRPMSNSQPGQCTAIQAALAESVNVAAFFLTNSCMLSGICPVSANTSSDIRS